MSPNERPYMTSYPSPIVTLVILNEEIWRYRPLKNCVTWIDLSRSLKVKDNGAKYNTISYSLHTPQAGADPGFRRGGFVHSEGGGFVQEFQERIQIVAGPWANQQAKKNCRQP